MSNEIREAWVNMCFRDEQLADFVAVKQYLGLQNNTDVIRLLVRKEAHAIRHAQALRSPDSPSLGRGTADAPPRSRSAPGVQPTRSELDALCLACSLPECDDGDPHCPYQQAVGELEAHRAQQRAAAQRKRAARRRRASRRDA